MRTWWITLVCSLLTGCTPINDRLGLEPDNFAEELFEDFLERNISIDVDLTPESEEWR